MLRACNAVHDILEDIFWSLVFPVYFSHVLICTITAFKEESFMVLVYYFSLCCFARKLKRD